MRPLRWKSKYWIGTPLIDNRSRSLVDTLNEVAAEANGEEHCQDLNEFFGKIASATENMLIKLNKSPPDAGGEVELFENQLRRLLQSKLPLSARGCRSSLFIRSTDNGADITSALVAVMKST